MKNNYEAPAVVEVILSPREAVLEVTSPITLSALTISGTPDIPAVEDAAFSNNVEW